MENQDMRSKQRLDAALSACPDSPSSGSIRGHEFVAGYYYRGDPEARRWTPLPGVDRKPFVTWTLLAVNIVLWVAMENAGGSDNPEVLLEFGAMFGPLIARGEYWRLFTAMFLHVGILHLLFNMFGLFIFGRLVEGIYGHGRFTAIYILSGLAGSVASYWLNKIAIGAGASGAIFGILGTLVAFFVAKRNAMGDMGRQNLTAILVMAAINLAYGFFNPGVDNWAHLGGLIGGFLLGLAFVPQYRYRTLQTPFGVDYRQVDTNSLIRRWWVLPVAAAILAVVVWRGTSTLPDNALSHMLRAERLLEQRNYGEALDEITESIKLDNTNGRAYYVRGRIFAETGNAARARGELFKAIALAREARDEDTVAMARELLQTPSLRQ
jgi:rhomboid protease GluP